MTIADDSSPGAPPAPGATAGATGGGATTVVVPTTMGDAPDDRARKGTLTHQLRSRSSRALLQARARAFESAARVTPTQHRIALLVMVVAPCCWAVAGPMLRLLSFVDAFETTMVRTWFMGAFMLGWELAAARGSVRAVYARLVGVGNTGFWVSLGWSAMFIFNVLAMSLTSIANVLIVFAVSPLIGALLARVILHEPVANHTVVAMVTSFVGLVIMVGDGVGTDGFVGDMLAFVMPTTFAMVLVLLRARDAKVDQQPTLIWTALWCTVACLPLALPLQFTSLDLLYMGIMGVVGLGIGTAALMAASDYLSVAETELLSMLESIAGPLFTFLAVGERPTDMALLGGAIVLSSIAINTAWAAYHDDGKKQTATQEGMGDGMEMELSSLKPARGGDPEVSDVGDSAAAVTPDAGVGSEAEAAATPVEMVSVVTS